MLQIHRQSKVKPGANLSGGPGEIQIHYRLTPEHVNMREHKYKYNPKKLFRTLYVQLPRSWDQFQGRFSPLGPDKMI